MSKKLDTQLEKYYEEIKHLIPDPKDQKMVLQGLKNNIRSYLKEKPTATFNEVTSRYGKPAEIAEYYMTESDEEDTPPKLAMNRVPIFSAIAAVLVVGAIVVIAVINRPNKEIPVGIDAESSSQESFISSEESSIPSVVTSSQTEESASSKAPTSSTVSDESSDVSDKSSSSEESSKESSEESSNDPVTKADPYIIADSGARLLNEDDLKALSKDDLMRARNEIYARHGRRFSDPALQDYFNNQSWYTGTIDPDNFSQFNMSEVESRNIDFIMNYESN